MPSQSRTPPTSGAGVGKLAMLALKQRAGLWGFQRLVPLMIETKKAAPHGEAFTININLKILFMKKLFTSFFQPNDDDCTNEQPCEQEPRPPRHVGRLHDTHVVTCVMVCLVD